MGHEIKTVTVVSWTRLVELLNQLSDNVFRGQCSAQWDLETTLERQAPRTQAPVLE